MNFQADDRLELGVSGNGFLRDRGHEVEIIKGHAGMALSWKIQNIDWQKLRLGIARGIQVLVDIYLEEDEFGAFCVVDS